MPATNSDSESSTGSSGRSHRFDRFPNRGRRNHFCRYRCSSCPQVFSSPDSLNLHRVESHATPTERALLCVLESRRRQRNQPNDHPQDPPPRRRRAPATSNPNPSGPSPARTYGSMAIVGTYNSNNQTQPLPKEDARGYPPNPQKRTGPVAEETNWQNTRDLLTLFGKPGAGLGSPERTMADQIRKGKGVDGEGANSGTKQEELDLDLKLAPGI